MNNKFKNYSASYVESHDRSMRAVNGITDLHHFENASIPALISNIVFIWKPGTLFTF